LINGWQNVTSTRPAAYAIDLQGTVHLQGEIENGMQFQPAFTLPVAARPNVTILVPTVESALRVGSLDIEVNGQVDPQDPPDFGGTAVTETFLDGVVYSPK
jgi:hypothetical protein